MPKIIISSKDVISALSKLNTKKAYGPDSIPPVVLKTCVSELAPCRGKLFRLCLSTSTFPSCWKRALIQPVPKKGDPSQPSNYRPISLTSILSKVFESILNRKIWKHLNSSNLTSYRQYGFRKKRCTGDLSLLSDPWYSTQRSGHFESFRRVCYKALISNLPSFGIYPSICGLLSYFLSGHSIAAVVDCHRSSFKSINSGVPPYSYLFQHFFHFSLMIFSLLLHYQSTPMLMTPPFITPFSLKATVKHQNGGLGATNLWSFSHFILRQRKHSSFQYLKNSVPPYLFSAQSSIQL